MITGGGGEARSEAVEAVVDEAGGTRRVSLGLGLVALQLMLEVFDYFIVGFLVAVVAASWELSFGTISIMLLSGGLGTIIGSVLGGQIADRIGRKPVFVGAGLVYAVSAGAIAFIPEGSWQTFAFLRLFVGIGIGFGAAGGAQFTYVSEIVPRQRRTLLSSMVQIPISLGVLIASLTASLLLPLLGWRGVAALGFVPVLITLLQALVCPESIRWQVARGLKDRAERNLSGLLGRDVEIEATAAPTGKRKGGIALAEMLRFPRETILIVCVAFGAALAVNGVLLWGPTILANLLTISGAEAAEAFVYVSIAGIIGRIGFTALATWLGRRVSGQIMGYGGFLALLAAGLLFDQHVFGVSVFFIALVVSALFWDGGHANINPMPPEVFPTHLAASAAGLAMATNGTAKLVTPLLLAWVAGPQKQISTATVQDAVLPIMLIIAAALLAIGLSFSLLAPRVRNDGQRL